MATKFKCNDGIYTVLRNGKAVAISATAGEAVEAIAADAEEIACPPEPPARLGLRITTTPGGLPPFDLAAWNTFFDLPANGTPFTDVSVAGDEVTLYGGAGITLKASLFRNSATLLKIEDDVDCVVAVAGGKNAGAISLCSALTTVTLNGVTTVAQEGLYNNPNLATVNMTALVNAGASAFAACTNLTTLNTPAVTTIGQDCYKGCTSIEFFNGINNSIIPNLTSAGVSAFEGCTGTTAFVVNGLSTVANLLFKDCTNVVTIAIASCTALGSTTANNNVFENCTSLANVYCPTALATVDGGNPDGDLVYAAGTLGATINYI